MRRSRKPSPPNPLAGKQRQFRRADNRDMGFFLRGGEHLLPLRRCARLPILRRGEPGIIGDEAKAGEKERGAHHPRPAGFSRGNRR